MVGGWKKRRAGRDAGKHSEVEVAKTLVSFMRQAQDHARSQQSRLLA